MFAVIGQRSAASKIEYGRLVSAHIISKIEINNGLYVDRLLIEKETGLGT